VQETIGDRKTPKHITNQAAAVHRSSKPRLAAYQHIGPQNRGLLPVSTSRDVQKNKKSSANLQDGHTKVAYLSS
jgi:hypothetical protein